jgi:hypothetical protein
MLSPSQRPERPGTSTDPVHDRIAECRSGWRAWSNVCSRQPASIHSTEYAACQQSEKAAYTEWAQKYGHLLSTRPTTINGAVRLIDTFIEVECALGDANELIESLLRILRGVLESLADSGIGTNAGQAPVESHRVRPRNRDWLFG